MVKIETDTQFVWDILAQIPDPEIPVINIIELGVVRAVEFIDDECVVTITPTYSGCPAMKMIEDDIITNLQNNKIEKVKVKTVLSPPWTTDWINEVAKEKLREYGIAPPHKATPNKKALFAEAEVVKCPRCRSENTEMTSQFGSTPCKALYKCIDCLEPFDYFKCL